MIDTIYIYTQLSKEDYNTIYNRINSMSKLDKVNLKSKDTNNETTKAYSTNYLCEQGFLEIILRSTKQNNGFKRRAIEIKLKPKKLIEPQNYSDVTYAVELKEIRNEFNKIISQINPILPDFWEWKCKRVDYAITVYTQYVPDYIELFKRGDVGEIFKEKAGDFYNEKGSLYLKSDDVIINFYDKHNQLIKTNHRVGKEENYKDAENKIRLEVQCMNQKIRNIKEKYKLSSTKVKDLLQPYISKDVITYYYKKVNGKKDYYCLKKAVKMLIDNQKNLKYKPMEYINVLNFIEISGSVWKAFANNPLGSNSAFEKRIREIKKIGINPVLIPNEWDYHKLPNLYKQIMV